MSSPINHQQILPAMLSSIYRSVGTILAADQGHAIGQQLAHMGAIASDSHEQERIAAGDRDAMGRALAAAKRYLLTKYLNLDYLRAAGALRPWVAVLGDIERCAVAISEADSMVAIEAPLFALLRALATHYADHGPQFDRRYSYAWEIELLGTLLPLRGGREDHPVWVWPRLLAAQTIATAPAGVAAVQRLIEEYDLEHANARIIEELAGDSDSLPLSGEGGLCMLINGNKSKRYIADTLKPALEQLRELGLVDYIGEGNKRRWTVTDKVRNRIAGKM